MVEAWTDRTAFAFLVRTMILTLHFPLMELYFLRPGAPPPLTLSHSSPGALRPVSHLSFWGVRGFASY